VGLLAYFGGTMIQGLLVINYPSYNLQRWHGTLLLFALILFSLFFNTFLASHLPKVEGSVLILHIVGFFAILITLVYLAPHGSPYDVFVKYLTLGGYSPGVSFFVGLTTAVVAFLGADGAVHMCEEIKNASTVLPRSLLISIGINGTLGFAMLIAILFCIGDINNALSTSTGFPFIEIFLQATNSPGGASAMTAIVLSMLTMAGTAFLTAASRLMWAFARDNALPYSSYLSRVEPRTKLPLYSIGVSVVFTMLLGLINIGSAAAVTAVTSLVVSGYMGSYILPISLLLVKRIRNPDVVNYGPFSLGKLGIPTNIFALIWIVIVMIFSFFPSAIPIALSTMNWSCLLWGGTMIFGVAFYFSYQRGRYNGPIFETTMVNHMNGL
jgi:choline transport protein